MILGLAPGSGSKVKGIQVAAPRSKKLDLNPSCRGLVVKSGGP